MIMVISGQKAENPRKLACIRIFVPDDSSAGRALRCPFFLFPVVYVDVAVKGKF